MILFSENNTGHVIHYEMNRERIVTLIRIRCQLMGKFYLLSEILRFQVLLNFIEIKFADMAGDLPCFSHVTNFLKKLGASQCTYPTKQRTLPPYNVPCKRVMYFHMDSCQTATLPIVY